VLPANPTIDFAVNLNVGQHKANMKVKAKTISDEMLDEGAPSYQSLTPGNVYRVLELSKEDIRVMNDVGEPGLYPLSWFSVVDDRWPDDWIVTIGTEGERTATPKVLSENYFWERYFDGDKEAILALKRRLLKWGYTDE